MGSMQHMSRLILSFVVLFALMLLYALPENSLAAPSPKIWLMGEVHDNPDAHAYRLRDVQVLLAKGYRPAILMEQFDVQKQAQLTQAWQTCQKASCVVKAAGGKGWDWSLYEPLIQLALDRRLPLIAANLSREQLRAVMQRGFAAVFDQKTIDRFGLNQPFPATWLAGQRQAIDIGHCNMLPASAIDPMVKGQAARDVMFAKLIADYAPQGVVLIAGNGHVRKDLGVSQWLPAQLQSSAVVSGYVEPSGITTRAFDRVRVVPAHPRPDPCEAFRRPQSRS